MLKKSGDKGRSRRPPGHSPVIAVRVPEFLYRRIKESAKRSKRTMSEEMASLIERTFEFQDAFGEIKNMMAESKRVTKENLKAEMRRQGWRRIHGTPNWIAPEAVLKNEFGQTESGFIADTELDRIDTALDGIEKRIRALKKGKSI
jgi:hypothetical protein